MQHYATITTTGLFSLKAVSPIQSQSSFIRLGNLGKSSQMTFMDSAGTINYVYPTNMMSVASGKAKGKNPKCSALT